jgi:hypothetical protein
LLPWLNEDGLSSEANEIEGEDEEEEDIYCKNYQY